YLRCLAFVRRALPDVGLVGRVVWCLGWRRAVLGGSVARRLSCSVVCRGWPACPAGAVPRWRCGAPGAPAAAGPCGALPGTALRTRRGVHGRAPDGVAPWCRAVSCACAVVAPEREDPVHDRGPGSGEVVLDALRQGVPQTLPELRVLELGRVRRVAHVAALD